MTIAIEGVTRDSLKVMFIFAGFDVYQEDSDWMHLSPVVKLGSHYMNSDAFAAINMKTGYGIVQRWRGANKIWEISEYRLTEEGKLEEMLEWMAVTTEEIK